MDCDCINKLIEAGFLEKEGVLNFKTGNFTDRVILREIKCGNSGKLTVGRKWLVINKCPACGADIETNKIPLA